MWSVLMKIDTKNNMTREEFLEIQIKLLKARITELERKHPDKDVKYS